MKKYFILSSSLIITALTTTAYAADPVKIYAPAPQPVAISKTVPAFNWGGAYIGGQIDYSMLKHKYSSPGYPDFQTRNKTFLGGIYTGYNFNVGNNIILGAELDFTKTLRKYKRGDVAQDALYTVDSYLNWSGAARVRAGYAMNRFMPYIAGGLAFGSIKDTVRTNWSYSASDKIRTGWTIGAGADYAVTDNVILRLEYRYTDLGKQNFNLSNSVSYGRKLSSNDIRLGVAYKF